MAGKIKFVKRGQALAATISEDDLAAHEWGSEVPNPLDKTRAQDLELPHDVNVIYINSGADYQQGTQKSERQTGSGVSVMNIPLPVVMDDAKAKQVADVNHYNAWVGRTTYTLQLSRKWSKLEPTDVIDVVYGTTTFRMRITKKDDSKPGIIRLECVAEDSEIYTQSGLGAGSANISTQTVTIPVQTLGILLDIPMLRDLDNDAGIYFAACGYRTGWNGCALFKSNDDGATYTQGFGISTAATIGNATTALADFYGGSIFDELTSVTVQLIAGSLSSASELAVLNGSNYAVLGNEIIQFKNATLISANTYTLTGLLRGRRGTEWAMSSHAIGDRFVLANTSTWRRLELPTSDIGLTRLYKAVSFGMTLQQTASQPYTSAGVGLECYAPVEVGAGRDASNNLTINWKRRNRISGEWRDYIEVPMSESTESYEVDVYSDSTFATVLRTITATTSTASYTSAQQITDFGIEQSELYIKVYQLSAIVGRGYAASASLSIAKDPIYATQWRVYITENQSGGVTSAFKEIEMRATVGGADQCTGGTASADSDDGFGDVAANAFDDASGSLWQSGFGAVPHWIQYTFASSVTVKQISLIVQTGAAGPKSWKFEYYNGSSWVAVRTVTSGATWADAETKTYIVG